jgi:hypothetical protein
MAAEVRVYRLSRQGKAKTLRRRQIITGVLFSVFVASSVVWLGWAEHFEKTALEIFLLLLLLILVPAFVLGSRQWRSELEAFGIALGPDVVRCVRRDALPVEMFRNEVTRMVEARAGLLLRAENPARAIVVSSKLDGYADARALLVTWRTPVPISAATRRRRAGVLASALLLLPSYLVARYEASTVLALLGTLLFAGFGGWIVFMVAREPLFGGRQKGLLFIILGWLALSVLWRWAGTLWGFPP